MDRQAYAVRWVSPLPCKQALNTLSQRKPSAKSHRDRLTAPYRHIIVQIVLVVLILLVFRNIYDHRSGSYLIIVTGSRHA